MGQRDRPVRAEVLSPAAEKQCTPRFDSEAWGFVFAAWWQTGAQAAATLKLAVHTVTAIYPGSFDPVTNGHLDLVARGSKLFDRLVVAVLRNASKNPLFSVVERVEMLRAGTAHFGNVEVATFEGLLVDFAREQGAQAVLRGIRAISDYEYELQMAHMNRRLNPGVETIFLMPDAQYSYVSSRLVKEVFRVGGSVEGLVPQLVIDRLKSRAAGHGLPESSDD